jgi:hypothetical protein
MATQKTAAKQTKSAKAKKRSAQPDVSKTKAKSASQRLTALDAAAKVLKEKAKALACKELIDLMAAKGYWKSPGGKTPAATLYAAMAREIATKGAESRFTRADRGKFAAAR